MSDKFLQLNNGKKIDIERFYGEVKSSDIASKFNQIFNIFDLHKDKTIGFAESYYLSSILLPLANKSDGNTRVLSKQDIQTIKKFMPELKNISEDEITEFLSIIYDAYEKQKLENSTDFSINYLMQYTENGENALNELDNYGWGKLGKFAKELFSLDFNKYENYEENLRESAQKADILSMAKFSGIEAFLETYNKKFNKDYNIKKAEAFYNSAYKYQFVRALKQRTEALHKGIATIKLISRQEEDASRLKTPAQRQAAMPELSSREYFGKLIDFYFEDNDEFKKEILQKIAPEYSRASSRDEFIEILDRLKSETEIAYKNVLNGERYEDIQSDYEEKFKDMYGLEELSDEIQEDVMGAMQIGSGLKIATLIAIQILITRGIGLNSVGVTAGTAGAIGSTSNLTKNIINISQILIKKYGEEQAKAIIMGLSAIGTITLDAGLEAFGVAISKDGFSKENINKAIERTGASAGYITFGTIVHTTIASKIVKALSANKSMTYAMSQGVIKTSGGITTRTLSAREFISKVGEYSSKLGVKTQNLAASGAGFATEIGAFGLLDSVIHDINIEDSMSSSAEMLTQLKIIHYILYAILGRNNKAFASSMINKNNKSELILPEKTFLNDLEIVETSTPDGKATYSIKMKGQTLFSTKNPAEMTVELINAYTNFLDSNERMQILKNYEENAIKIRKARESMGFSETEKLIPDKIESRFKELAKKFHPDKTGGSPEKMQEINDAYTILKTYPEMLLPSTKETIAKTSKDSKTDPADLATETTTETSEIIKTEPIATIRKFNFKDRIKNAYVATKISPKFIFEKKELQQLIQNLKKTRMEDGTPRFNNRTLKEIALIAKENVEYSKKVLDLKYLDKDGTEHYLITDATELQYLLAAHKISPELTELLLNEKADPQKEHQTPRFAMYQLKEIVAKGQSCPEFLNFIIKETITNNKGIESYRFYGYSIISLLDLYESAPQLTKNLVELNLEYLNEPYKLQEYEIKNIENDSQTNPRIAELISYIIDLQHKNGSNIKLGTLSVFLSTICEQPNIDLKSIDLSLLKRQNSDGSFKYLIDSPNKAIKLSQDPNFDIDKLKTLSAIKRQNSDGIKEYLLSAKDAISYAQNPNFDTEKFKALIEIKRPNRDGIEEYLFGAEDAISYAQNPNFDTEKFKCLVELKDQNNEDFEEFLLEPIMAIALATHPYPSLEKFKTIKTSQDFYNLLNIDISNEKLKKALTPIELKIKKGNRNSLERFQTYKFEPSDPKYNKDIPRFCRELQARLEREMGVLDERYISNIVDELSSKMQISDSVVLEIMQRLTQFGSFKRLKNLSKELDKYGIYEFYTESGISTSSTLHYLQAKGQIILNNLPGKQAFILDHIGVKYLENLDIQKRIEFYKKVVSGDIVLIELDGTNLKIGDNYYSYTMLDGAQSLSAMTEAVIEQVKAGKTLDEVFQSDIRKRLNRAFKFLTPDFSTKSFADLYIKTISSRDAANVENITAQIKPNIPDAKYIEKIISTVIEKTENLTESEKIIAKSVIAKYYDYMVKVFSPDSFQELLKEKYQYIEMYVSSLGKTMDDVIHIYPETNKSFELICLQYAKINGIDPSKICLYNGTNYNESFDGKVLVLLDDIAGSGKSMIEQVFHYNECLSKQKNISLIFAPITCAASGYNYIKTSIENSHRTGQDFLAYSSTQITNYEEFTKMLAPEEYKVFAKIEGQRGYTEGGLATGFQYMIPDNCSTLGAYLLLKLLNNPNSNGNKQNSSTRNEIGKILLEYINSES